MCLDSVHLIHDLVHGVVYVWIEVNRQEQKVCDEKLLPCLDRQIWQ